MTVIPRGSQFERKNMLWLEVTNFCNLECAHCYNTSGSHESLTPSISLERYRQILDEARRIEFRSVQFIGGEPFFYPHLRELVDRALDLGFQEIEIFSNLTVVPQWLFEPVYRRIQLATSFYSDDPEVHDQICVAKDSFKRTITSIRKLIGAGFTLRVGFIEMAANAGQFERTCIFLRDLGVTTVGHDAVRQFGRAERKEPPSMQQLCGKCSDGNLCIDVDGNVAACIMSKPWAFGNIRDASLMELFDSQERHRFVRDLKTVAQQHVKRDQVSEPDRKWHPAQGCDPFCNPACTPSCNPACNPACTPSCNPACNPSCTPSCGPAR